MTCLLSSATNYQIMFRNELQRYKALSCERTKPTFYDGQYASICLPESGGNPSLLIRRFPFKICKLKKS